MKKIDILGWFFLSLFTIEFIYFEFYLQFHSFDWLVFELIGYVIVYICLIHTIVRKNQYGKHYAFLMASLTLFNFGNMAYRDIAKYRLDDAVDRFGEQFNKRRSSLGFPQIPANFYLTSKNETVIDWKAKNGTTGHTRKYIALDHSYKIEFENDYYSLKPDSGISRFVYITVKYAQGKSRDSIFYNYDAGDSSRVISRQQADSIFSVEKIRKDY